MKKKFIYRIVGIIGLIVCIGHLIHGFSTSPDGTIFGGFYRHPSDIVGSIIGFFVMIVGFTFEFFTLKKRE